MEVIKTGHLETKEIVKLPDQFLREGFTIKFTHLSGVKHDSKTDLYSASFEKSSRRSSVKVNVEVAKFLLEHRHYLGPVYYLSMFRGEVVDVIITTAD